MGTLTYVIGTLKLELDSQPDFLVFPTPFLTVVARSASGASPTASMLVPMRGPLWVDSGAA